MDGVVEALALSGERKIKGRAITVEQPQLREKGKSNRALGASEPGPWRQLGPPPSHPGFHAPPALEDAVAMAPERAVFVGNLSFASTDDEILAIFKVSEGCWPSSAPPLCR